MKNYGPGSSNTSKKSIQDLKFYNPTPKASDLKLLNPGKAESLLRSSKGQLDFYQAINRPGSGKDSMVFGSEMVQLLGKRIRGEVDAEGNPFPEE